MTLFFWFFASTKFKVCPSASKRFYCCEQPIHFMGKNTVCCHLNQPSNASSSLFTRSAATSGCCFLFRVLNNVHKLFNIFIIFAYSVDVCILSPPLALYSLLTAQVTPDIYDIWGFFNHISFQTHNTQKLRL